MGLTPRHTADLRAKVERLVDLDRIRDVVLRYGRSVDRCDWALAHACYHDDAVDEHGIFNGNAHEFVDFLEGFVPDFTEYSQHAAMNSLVRLEGDVAFAETYHVGYHRLPQQDGRDLDVPIAGRAVDRLERRDGEWRLAHRVLVVDWARNDPPAAVFAAPPGTVLGRRDAGDPSYAAFERTRGPMSDTAQTPDADQLEAQIEMLLAKEEIREVIARFARGVDRFDWELQRSCYHDDAQDHHGIYDGPIDGFIEFGRQWLPEATESTTHAVMNCLIEIDGDVAAAETYIIGYHRGTFPETGVLSDLIVAGRYVDRFERRDGRWLIADRTFVFDWSRVDPVGEIHDPPVGGATGSRDRSDPSYTALP